MTRARYPSLYGSLEQAEKVARRYARWTRRPAAVFHIPNAHMWTVRKESDSQRPHWRFVGLIYPPYRVADIVGLGECDRCGRGRPLYGTFDGRQECQECARKAVCV